jgi:hypothetical protein
MILSVLLRTLRDSLTAHPRMAGKNLQRASVVQFANGLLLQVRLRAFRGAVLAPLLRHAGTPYGEPTFAYLAVDAGELCHVSRRVSIP